MCVLQVCNESIVLFFIILNSGHLFIMVHITSSPFDPPHRESCIVLCSVCKNKRLTELSRPLFCNSDLREQQNILPKAKPKWILRKL